MGSYSVRCVATGLDIEYGKCYFLPLVNSTRYYSKNYQRINQYSRDKKSETYTIDKPISPANPLYASYSPLTYPIEIIYDTYGSFDEIKHDTNTEAIEKYFKIPIEEFLSNILTKEDGFYEFEYKYFTYDNLGRTKHVAKLPVTGCFINKEFYDECINIHTQFGELTTLKESISLQVVVLERLGFKLVRDLNEKDTLSANIPEDWDEFIDNVTELDLDDKKERFNLVYVLDDLPEFEIYSDGQFNHIEKNEGLYTVADLVQYLKNKYDYVLDVSSLSNYTEYSIMYDEIVREFQKIKGCNLLSQLVRIDYTLGQNTLPFDPIKYIYKDLFFNGEGSIKEHFVKWEHFQRFVSVNNVQLLPCVGGMQSPSLLSNVKMCQMVLSILKNKISELDSDDSDTNYAEEFMKILNMV